jgi:hypothetical protein
MYYTRPRKLLLTINTACLIELASSLDIQLIRGEGVEPRRLISIKVLH